MFPTRAEQQREVDRNHEVFMTLVEDLRQDNDGRFALMRDQRIVGIFDTLRDAAVAGESMFGDGRFSIEQIVAEPVDLGFYSHAADIG
jgi:hypothetical protein